jgi:hypothetical protein
LLASAPPEKNPHVALWLMQAKLNVLTDYISQPKVDHGKKIKQIAPHGEWLKTNIMRLDPDKKRIWLHKLDDVLKIFVETAINLNVPMMALSLTRFCLTMFQAHDK